MRLERSRADYPHHGEPWHLAEVNCLVAACERPISAYAIAEEFSQVLGRTAESIRTKITQLKLHKARRKRADELPRLFRVPDSDPIDVTDARPVDDGRFMQAMLREIKLKTENPPIGVDGRPCTKAPIFVRRGDIDGVLTQSAIAEF